MPRTANPIDAMEQLPPTLRSFMDFERFYLHDRALYQRPENDPAFPAEFFPQNAQVARLPCFRVPSRHLYLYGQSASEEGSWGPFDGAGRAEIVLFPVHPSALAFYDAFFNAVGAVHADDVWVWAVPTSSMRTLLTWPDGQPERATFVKTSLHSPIFGDRHLYRRVVARSVGLSTLLESACKPGPSMFRYLPERAGVVPRRLQNGGVLTRSVPAEWKAGEELAIPLFALLSTPESHPPLLLEILEGLGMSLHDFVEGVLCVPFARIWFQLVFRSGLLLEAHAQDLLLTFTPGYREVRGFCYRDCEGLQIDTDLRQALGLAYPPGLPCEFRWHDTYETLGYQQTQLSWYKFHLSLSNYVKYFLGELDREMEAWRAKGVLSDRPMTERCSAIFTRALVQEISGLVMTRPRGACKDMLDAPFAFAQYLKRARAEVCGNDFRASLITLYASGARQAPGQPVLLGDRKG